jgi:hypothetical protein
MRLTPTARVLFLSVLLLAATALLWWGVGFRLGAGLLDDPGAWRRSFGYGPVALMRLFALALAIPVAIAVAASASAQGRWLSLAAIAFGAVLLYGDRTTGDVLAVVLLVFAAAAVAEAGGALQIVLAFAAAVLVAFAAVWDLGVGTSERMVAVVVRAAFFYAPLLLGPSLLERHALKRLVK